MPDKPPKGSHNLKGGTMRAALPREGGIADQHDKRKQPSEICRLTSQRGVKPGKNSCLGSRFAIAFSVSTELRLRGLDPPFQAVKAEISRLQGALKRIGPHASSPDFEQKVSEFLVQRSKPKH